MIRYDYCDHCGRRYVASYHAQAGLWTLLCPLTRAVRRVVAADSWGAMTRDELQQIGALTDEALRVAQAQQAVTA